MVSVNSGRHEVSTSAHRVFVGLVGGDHRRVVRQVFHLKAIAYAQSGNAAQAPMLSAEAAARGITLGAMLTRVQANANAFAALEAAIGGADGKHRDALAALQSFEAVLAYDLTAGWPVV